MVFNRSDKLQFFPLFTLAACENISFEVYGFLCGLLCASVVVGGWVGVGVKNFNHFSKRKNGTPSCGRLSNRFWDCMSHDCSEKFGFSYLLWILKPDCLSLSQADTILQKQRKSILWYTNKDVWVKLIIWSSVCVEWYHNTQYDIMGNT